MNNIDHIPALGLGKEHLFKFHTLRDISTESDKEKKRRILVGQADISQIISIPEFGNVRRYLKKNKSGKKLAGSGVHHLIRSSLENNPEDFNFLNGGVTITCSGMGKQDNNLKQVIFINPTIINGSQTKGVCEIFLEDFPDNKVVCQFQVICLLENKHNIGLADDIAISRNQQNKVKDISIAGKKGILDDLIKSVNIDLQTDESQTENFDTLKLLQLLFLITPFDMWEKLMPSVKSNKAAVYSSKAKWLKLFRKIYLKKEENDEFRQLYDFFIDIAQDVLDLYLKLKHADFLKGTHRQIKEGFKQDLFEKYTIHDGWLFPIISSFSFYVEKNKGSWKINSPKNINIRGILALIYQQGNYRDHQNVQLLGKTENAYFSPYELMSETADIEKMLKKYESRVFG